MELRERSFSIRACCSHPLFLRIAFSGGIALILVAVLLARKVAAVRESERRSNCRGHLKCLTVALANYADQYGSFPPAFTTDGNGRPLHSWRTLLLPYIDRADIYKRLDLSKPWDDPINAFALGMEVAAFRCPSGDTPLTTYHAVVGKETAIREGKSLAPNEISRSPRKVLLLVEVNPERAVHWMSPVDAGAEFLLSFEKNTHSNHRAAPGLFHCADADWQIRVIDHELSPGDRHLAISATSQAPNERTGQQQ